MRPALGSTHGPGPCIARPEWIFTATGGYPNIRNGQGNKLRNLSLRASAPRRLLWHTHCTHPGDLSSDHPIVPPHQHQPQIILALNRQMGPTTPGSYQGDTVSQKLYATEQSKRPTGSTLFARMLLF